MISSLIVPTSAAFPSLAGNPPLLFATDTILRRALTVPFVLMAVVYGALLLLTLASSAFHAPSAHAQSALTPTPDSLMDRLIGEWVMTGTIAGDEIVHDVTVDWILGRRYVRIHELARERTADGEPAYEAWIHIAWDEARGEYAVMWLDNTGVTNFAAEGVGHGKPDGDRIPLVWRSADGSGIRNTFAYDPASDTWTWAIDNVDIAANASPFARVTLRRK